MDFSFPLLSFSWVDLAVIAAILGVLLCWPRRPGVDRYETFIAAAPREVWDTYFIHVRKADYRPGTRVLDAVTIAEEPLTVRITLQFDLNVEPTEVVLVYDVWEPYTRYRVRARESAKFEEGEFIAEAGGTRLKVAVTGPRRGWILPWIVRRRVERHQLALKAVCEGREPEPPRAPPAPSARMPSCWTWPVSTRTPATSAVRLSA